MTAPEIVDGGERQPTTAPAVGTPVKIGEAVDMDVPLLLWELGS